MYYMRRNLGSGEEVYLSSSRAGLGTGTGTAASSQGSSLRAESGVLGDDDGLVLGSNGTGSQGGNDSSGRDTHCDEFI